MNKNAANVAVDVAKNIEFVERLKSCLYKPGTKFTVTGEIKNKGKGALSPGSCGFVSYIKGSSKKYQ